MKRNYIVAASLILGALIVYKEMKKRRETMEENNNKIDHKVANDFGGTVPKPLYRYLKRLGEDTRMKGNFELWGYGKTLEMSKRVTDSEEGDVFIVLGEDNITVPGKTLLLIYTRNSFPEHLVSALHDPETSELTYYHRVEFNSLYK